MGSVRWAFRYGSWTPSRSDWLFAARCIQREEKERIGEFLFPKDAKSSMTESAAHSGYTGSPAPPGWQIHTCRSVSQLSRRRLEEVPRDGPLHVESRGMESTQQQDQHLLLSARRRRRRTARAPQNDPQWDFCRFQAGRLLLRKFVFEKMGIPWSEIRLERSPRGKPYLAAPVKVSSESELAWSFNLSHQGDYTVLAAEQGRQVGVDIMKIAMPGSSSVPEFFRIMTRQFTAHEWSSIQSAGSEHQQLAGFYRHWALKESFIKAIGTGLGFNLQRVEFHLPSEPLTQGRVLRQTKMHLDEEEEEDWVFEESLLDADHHVAVALGPADKPCSARLPFSLLPPTTFTVLSFSELIASASPLTDEDPAYWDSFEMKAEAPQRQKDTHTST